MYTVFTADKEQGLICRDALAVKEWWQLKILKDDLKMIDSEGFRANVGIVISNQQGQLLWARRHGQNAWQFPQGGVDQGETPEQTMYRELHEEVGLKPEDVKLLKQTREWLHYRLPSRYLRQGSKPLCIGQKQKWFLLQLIGDEQLIRFDQGSRPEFDHWRWVSYWYPVRNVIDFKRDVYRQALSELLSSLNVKKQNTFRRRKRPQRHSPRS